MANWNGERVARSDEAGYLARLAADLRQDISTFDFFLEIYLIKQETILALREGPLDAVIATDLKDAALRLEYSLYKAIPKAKTRERFTRSLENLISLLPVLYECRLFGNSVKVDMEKGEMIERRLGQTARRSLPCGQTLSLARVCRAAG